MHVTVVMADRKMTVTFSSKDGTKKRLHGFLTALNS